MSARFPGGYWLWCIAALFGGGLLVVLTLSDTPSMLRTLLAYGFLPVCPGFAWVRILPLSSNAHRLALAIALSLTFGALVAEVLLYTRHWSFSLAALILVGFTVAGILMETALHDIDYLRQRRAEQNARD